MALTKRAQTNTVYLEVKHYSLWRPLKQKVEGCEAIEVTNPKTKQQLVKYGYRFDTVSGHAVKLAKYDTEKKYSTRYFGFKLHIAEGTETYVLDMPYNGQFLRRFLRVARNIDWNQPFSITIFKGKKKDRSDDELGVWFQQGGGTVKAYYTREEPHGMPEATYDNDLQQWDFKAQHRWLVARLIEETIPDIDVAAKTLAPPVEHDASEEQHASEPDDEMPPDYDDDFPPTSGAHPSGVDFAGRAMRATNGTSDDPALKKLLAGDLNAAMADLCEILRQKRGEQYCNQMWDKANAADPGPAAIVRRLYDISKVA